MALVQKFRPNNKQTYNAKLPAGAVVCLCGDPSILNIFQL